MIDKCLPNKVVIGMLSVASETALFAFVAGIRSTNGDTEGKPIDQWM